MPKLRTARGKTATLDPGPQSLETVGIGDRVMVNLVNDRGDIVKRTPLQFDVQAKCAHASTAGQWVCATHHMTFSNQFCKDSHIHTGKHVLGWFCFECNALQVP